MTVQVVDSLACSLCCRTHENDNAVGIFSYERILVADVDNGERFETYAIRGPRGSGVCCLNGAAAHKGKVGDRLIVMSFGTFAPEEAAGWQPMVKHFA